MIGRTVSHYKILEKIGSGGMGDVYLAEDTKLDRKVALKVLPPELAENEERRARFQREAKTIAALDHPNIVQVFSVEEAEGTHFITMQLVKGKTLTELLPKNGFALNEFFDIAIPLADAVAAAHQEGITHRDLKLDNIMLSDDGRVKVLDFGLAKPTGGFAGSEGPTAARTEEGVIVGTVAYMSPEQAEGKKVDHRTDVFSLGVVFYEMLTGRRPFTGETRISLITSIVKDTPTPLRELDAHIPHILEWIISRALEKDVDRRLQSAKDFRNALMEIQSGTHATQAQPVARKSDSVWVSTRTAAIGALLIAIVSFLAGMLIAPKATVVPQEGLVRLPANAPLALGRGVPLGFDMRLFDISADGSQLVYVGDIGATTQLFYHRIGEQGAVPLPGTEGAALPFFSPAGDWLGFVAGGRRLMRVLVDGGNPEPVCEATGVIWDAVWAEEDSIYFVDVAGGQLNRVSPTGAEVTAVATARSWGYDSFWPVSSLPEGRGLLLTPARLWPSGGDNSDIVVWDLASQKLEVVLERAGYDARYVETRNGDYLVYARGGRLWAAEFDVDTLEAGQPRLIESSVRVDGEFRQAYFAVSDDDTMVYIEGDDASMGVPTWVSFQDDGSIEQEPLEAPPQRYGSLATSPNLDRPYLALHVVAERDTIEMLDLTRGNRQRVIAGENGGWPLFAGDHLVFSAHGEQGNGLYWTRLNEASDAELLMKSEKRIIPYSFSRGLVSYTEHNPSRNAVLSLEGERETVLPSDGNDWGHHLSPDGNWVTYTTGRDGQWEVYVRSVNELTRMHKVSQGGGSEPIWSRDGSKIVYRNHDLWMEAMVETAPDFTSSKPRALGRTSFLAVIGTSWALGPDGRILVIKPVDENSNPLELRIVWNWLETL